MTFIRFINGLVDPLQKSVHAQSIAKISQSLGIPPWFVDLRHAATHGRLPSLELLKNGCRQALDWLRGNYWDAEEANDARKAGEADDTLERYAATLVGDAGSKQPNAPNLRTTAGQLAALPPTLIATLLLPRLSVTESIQPWIPFLDRLLDSTSSSLLLPSLLPHLAPKTVAQLAKSLKLTESLAQDFLKACLVRPEKGLVKALDELARRFPALESTVKPLGLYLSTLDSSSDFVPRDATTMDPELAQLLNSQLSSLVPVEQEGQTTSVETAGIWTRGKGGISAIGLLPGQTTEDGRRIMDSFKGFARVEAGGVEKEGATEVEMEVDEDEESVYEVKVW